MYFYFVTQRDGVHYDMTKIRAVFGTRIQICTDSTTRRNSRPAFKTCFYGQFSDIAQFM